MNKRSAMKVLYVIDNYTYCILTVKDLSELYNRYIPEEGTEKVPFDVWMVQMIAKNLVVRM